MLHCICSVLDYSGQSPMMNYDNNNRQQQQQYSIILQLILNPLAPQAAVLIEAGQDNQY